MNKEQDLLMKVEIAFDLLKIENDRLKEENERLRECLKECATKLHRLKYANGEYSFTVKWAEETVNKANQLLNKSI